MIPEQGAAPRDGPQPYVSKIDRRAALAWIGAATVGGASLVGAAVEIKGRRHAGTAQTPGYGNDPDLINAKASWPRLMTPLQLQTTALLCDFILPASGAHPSASAVGVPDFIDEWVSAPYPDQLLDRAALLGGLDFINSRSKKRHRRPAPDLSPADRAQIFQSLANKPSINMPGQAKVMARLEKGPLFYSLFGGSAFLRRFRLLTAGAYYTTNAGFADIGYVGNVALTSYPGPSAKTKALLDVRLKALGL